MTAIEPTAEPFPGKFVWTSQPDQDGDLVRVQNVRGFDGLMIGTGKPGRIKSALLPADEAREFLLSAFAVLYGERPGTTTDPREDTTNA
jgi:hypothetical protein